MGGKADILKAGMNALYYSGAHRVLAPYAGGIGLIFTLHQVTPEPPRAFSPNRILKVTPDFLDATIALVRASGVEIVSLDEAEARLASGDHDERRRFACFTLDDGYRDNRIHAYPIFKRHQAPFAIYVPTDYPDGMGELWWLALEAVIAGAEELALPAGMGRGTVRTHTVGEKNAAFSRFYRWLRTVDEDEQRAAVRTLCRQHDLDMEHLCRELIMTWEEIADLALDPLVTIGAHTKGHYALAKLTPDKARRQMADGADIIERRLGARPRHLSYPYGDAASAGSREFALAGEIGFATAVTTRKGVLFPEHRNHLTALPRISLNGDYQALRFVDLYLTGAPFALWNRFRKVNAA